MADAAVEAVRKESIRLYDLAVGIINDGLSIRRDLFQSEKKIKRVVRKSSEVIDENIDDLYERQVKALYGAILEFIVKIKGGYSGGKLREELNVIRQADQHVVEAVKGVKHLRKNLARFMQTDNTSIKREYDRLRRLIVRVLKEIELVRQAEDGSESILSLDQLKLGVEEKTEQISSGLDKLIRKDNIDVHMATSLMNDISYCREICWDLIEAGSVLFSTADLDEIMAMRSIALDEEEIVDMIEHPDEDS
jgi:phosphate:Na+ symporter